MIAEDKKSVSFPVIRVSQPIGDFYVGSMQAKDLAEISYFDIRRISLDERENFDTYLGIQREINRKRVEEIALYTQSPDATFPTAVVLAVDELCAELEPIEDGGNDRFFNMTLSNNPDTDDQILYRQIARVIDGQHRITGLMEAPNDNFEINVSIFVGADISDQATIFATVNLAQTKVNRSLVYDLFALSQSRSPEKTCHEVTVALDRTEGSPFFQRIKRLGKATEGRFGETLSQATVVQGILQHICANRLQVLQDRQTGAKGRKWSKLSAEESEKLVLRRFFLEDRDDHMANLLWNYFEAVATRWPDAWNTGGKGLILNKTNGFNALARFFRPAYLHLATPGDPVSKKDFLDLFSTVQLKDQDFNKEKFVPGSSGATALFNKMVEDTGV